MKVSVCAAYNTLTEKDIKDKTVIIIDTLRATSTIVTALANGCRQLIPVAEIEEAMSMYKTMDKSETLLGGERDSVRIQGFNLSNSPLEYTEKAVSGKILILTTTNGTSAILRVKGNARRIIVGALLNDRAAAKAALDAGGDILLLCAGDEGKLSFEDILAAGAIISCMAESGAKMELDDLGILAVRLFKSHSDDLLGAVRGFSHPEELIKKGFEKDVEFCMQRNVYDIAPVFEDGAIIKQ